MKDPIDIVMPVHNEALSIGDTLHEFHRVAFIENGIALRFVICEDGSSDNTVEVIQNLAKDLPIHLISDPVRKGYSKAVVDGFCAANSEFVGFIDSDGQCDPHDLLDFVRAHESGDYDLVFGYRNPRHDHPIRIMMSNSFGFVYRLFFSIPMRDPSCPFLLMRQGALQKALRGNPGILKQGFWWEFCARCISAHLRIKEIPVKHRVRASGQTQVYKPAKVPRIAVEHVMGLFKLKKELKELNLK